MTDENETELLLKADSTQVDENSSSSKYKKIGGVAALFLMGSSVLYVGKEQSSHLSSLTKTDQAEMGFRLSNDYTLSSEAGQGYVWLKEGTLVEPHKTAFLELTDVPGHYDQTKLTTSCSAQHLDSGTNIEPKTSAPVSCEIDFLDVGTYQFDVSVNHVRPNILDLFLVIFFQENK
jgi:hypothetical protein